MISNTNFNLNDIFQKIQKLKQPYIIAEIGANVMVVWLAKLISEAKIAGANCVKFQSWTKIQYFQRKNMKITIS